MTIHPKAFVFFGSLFLSFKLFLFFFPVCVCLRVSSVSVNVSSDEHRITLEKIHSKKKNLSPRTRTLACMSEECMKCPQKSF